MQNMLDRRKNRNIYSVGVGGKEGYMLTCIEFFEPEDLGSGSLITGLGQSTWVADYYVANMDTVGPKYVVMDEHTLGYLVDKTPTLMGVLAGSVLKGGHDWKNGAVSIVPGHTKLRMATEADFEFFRVMLPPDFVPADKPEKDAVPTKEQVALWAKEADPDFGNDDDDMAESIIGLAAVTRLVTIAYAAGRASVAQEGQTAPKEDTSGQGEAA
jgi:hypothetical protein